MMITDEQRDELRRMMWGRRDYLFLTRSEKGSLLLHQRMPSMPHSNKKNEHWAWTYPYPYVHHRGQVFAINEILNSKIVKFPRVKTDIIKCQLYILKPREETSNDLWVTRDSYGRLMLHHKIRPTRMNKSDEYNHWYPKRVTVVEENVMMNGEPWKHKIYDPSGAQERYIKKSGMKWTSWRGHMYVTEFPGSGNIRFEDEEPTRVGIKILSILI